MTDVHPFTFRLPAGWEARPETAAPVPGVDFAALYAIADQGFTPNITLSVQREVAGSEVAEIADATARQLLRSHPDLVVVRREELGTAAAPGIGQEVRFTADLAGGPTALTQIHVVLATGPEHDGHAVLKVALSATERQAPSLLPAFQEFVAGLRVGSGPAGS